MLPEETEVIPIVGLPMHCTIHTGAHGPLEPRHVKSSENYLEESWCIHRNNQLLHHNTATSIVYNKTGIVKAFVKSGEDILTKRAQRPSFKRNTTSRTIWFQRIAQNMRRWCNAMLLVICYNPLHHYGGFVEGAIRFGHNRIITY